MTEELKSEALGRSPFFYAGLMFGAYGVIAALAMTDATNNTTTLILMIAPLGLVIPLMRSANRRIDAGGPACMAKGVAQRRYTKRIMAFTSLYLIAMAGLTFALNEEGSAEALKIAFATLPGLAVIGIFWSIGRLIIEEQDEFIRMLVIRQSLIATAIALSAASIWGFLESADIVLHLDAYWVAIVWFAGLAVGAVMNRIQYGAWGAV
ncbi:hypothetical protein GCM10023115_05950 [Pontixanthobacter gangjinensis]|uniref:Uncharacterized protein n=1 Tax=Pontixanthobacter gangjinensis TaxID=1028742 RepID=A0A6I4SJP6_9SPHN|nr:hypothetical protein [Pontixanthobacter gangjinensis]MXO55844.1 hypothetical protein [Pontixanthobacter gangjinensis]